MTCYSSCPCWPWRWIWVNCCRMSVFSVFKFSFPATYHLNIFRFKNRDFNTMCTAGCWIRSTSTIGFTKRWWGQHKLQPGWTPFGLCLSSTFEFLFLYSGLIHYTFLHFLVMGDGYRDENGEFCSIYMILFCFVLIMRNGSGRLGHAIVHIQMG